MADPLAYTDQDYTDGLWMRGETIPPADPSGRHSSAQAAAETQGHARQWCSVRSRAGVGQQCFGCARLLWPPPCGRGGGGKFGGGRAVWGWDGIGVSCRAQRVEGGIREGPRGRGDDSEGGPATCCVVHRKRRGSAPGGPAGRVNATNVAYILDGEQFAERHSPCVFVTSKTEVGRCHAGLGVPLSHGILPSTLVDCMYSCEPSNGLGCVGRRRHPASELSSAVMGRMSDVGVLNEVMTEQAFSNERIGNRFEITRSYPVVGFENHRVKTGCGYRRSCMI